MDTDSVQSYAQTAPVASGADKLHQAGGRQQLPVDVLEAMQAGDLEKAMLLLKLHDESALDPGILAKLLALFPQISFKKIKGKKAEQTVLKRAPLTQKKAEAKVREQPRMIKEYAELYSETKRTVPLHKQLLSSLQEANAFVKQYLARPLQNAMQEWVQRTAEWIRKGDETFERVSAALLQLSKSLEEKLKNRCQKVAAKMEKITEPAQKVIQARVSEIKEAIATQLQSVQQATNQLVAYVTPPLQAVANRVKRQVEKSTKVANRLVRLPLLKLFGWGDKKFTKVVGYYHAVVVTMGGALHRITLHFWGLLVRWFWKFYRFCLAILKAVYFVVRNVPPFIWRLIKSLFRPKKTRSYRR